MVIQHNLASMGAFRQSKISTSRKAKTSERLASGYRINRAADDAAGLTISQKMRAQIRGLAQANENIQDGINFVKVGEGGMQEVQELLQRIRELSVQAANDTNTVGDRAAIQSEIDALTAEINQIAYRTSFNGHQMLCGDTTGSVSGTGSSGTGSVIDGIVSDALSNRATYGGSGEDLMSSAIQNPDGTIVFCGSTDSNDLDLNGSSSTPGVRSGWITKVGTDGEVLWTTTVGKGANEYLSSITATADGGYLAVGRSNGRPLLTKLDADGGIAWTYQFQCSGTDNNANNAFLMQDGSGHVFLSIQSFDGNGIKDGRGNPLGGPALGGRDAIMMVIDPSVNPNDNYDAFEKKAYRVGGSGNEQISRLYPTSDGGYIGGNYTLTSDFKQSNNDGSVTRPPTDVIGNGSHSSFITKFDKEGNVEKILRFGDNHAPGTSHNSGENIYQIIETASGEYVVVGSAAISDTVGTDVPSTDETNGKNIWVMKLDKNLTPIWSRSYGSSRDDVGNCVVETENGFVIAGSVGAMDGDVTQKPGYSGNNAWVFMIDKDSGDIIWDEVHGGSSSDSFNFIFESGSGDVLLGGNSSSNNADLAGKNKGKNDAWFLKLDGQTGTNAPPSGGSTGTGGSSVVKNGFIYLQVGANSGDCYRIDYADMRTTAIFGQNTSLNVMSHSAAEQVISLCDQAISYVSEQRSRYGSYQNALEHLYAANAITGENVSTSESRISDADIADETVEFSRCQILDQVNSSVMAQANMANQTVLKLLQG
ncbi:MAG: hypothetical protein HFI42_14030 [Lachnospiraceae bacterium]|nr:hypothetical protein [Lachnospiraceae bacterium]MCI9151581.1 hypothetical protein [Lachnospiraceae bacterium]